MSFVEAVKSALSKYATFSGRARRSEFWWFYLLFLVATGVPSALGTSMEIQALSLLGGLLWLGLILPLAAVWVRRLHDTGRSGWWFLLIVVPLVNIALLVFAALDSEPGTNKYGPNPKGVETPVTVTPEAPAAQVATETPAS